MRYLYFLIFIGILSVSAAGLIYFCQRFFDVYERVISAELQKNLSAIKLNEVEKIAEFLKEKPITLLFVGDIMLSRGVAKQIEKYQDNRYPFLKIASTTRSADLIFGNLEGPISNRGKNQGSIYSFRAKPEVIEGLVFAGFDILSLANNHIWDWGREALEDTVDILRENKIEPVGVGKNYEEANTPVIFDINLGTSDVPKINGNIRTSDVQRLKIVFLAYTNLYPKNLEAREDSAGISDFNLEKIKEKIQIIKKEELADFVIISFHWGDEYQNHASESQKRVGRDLIDSGADLIIGHHPHTIQEIEQYKDGWIAYSLGNFVFDQNFSEETMEGLMLKVIVKNKKIFEILPMKIKINNTFQPEIIH